MQEKSTLALRSRNALLWRRTRYSPPTNRNRLTLLRRPSTRNPSRDCRKETRLFTAALLFIISRNLVNRRSRSLLLCRSTPRYIRHLILAPFFAVLLIGNLGLFLLNLVFYVFLFLLEFHIPFNPDQNSIRPTNRNAGHVHAIVLEGMHKGTEICGGGTIVATQRRQTA